MSWNPGKLLKDIPALREKFPFPAIVLALLTCIVINYAICSVYMDTQFYEGILGFTTGTIFLILGYPKTKFYLQNTRVRNINNHVYFNQVVIGAMVAYFLALIKGKVISLAELDPVDLFDLKLIVAVFGGIFFSLIRTV